MCPTFFGKWPKPLLGAGLWTTYVKIAISSIPKLPHYFLIFIVHIENLQTWPLATCRLWVEHSWFKSST